MLITVAICTLNRAESLHRAFDSLAAMHLPVDLDWELVVVNNDCTDHTDDIIKAFTERLPLRRKFEPQRGLSYARNSAIDVAKGDYIIWTDDDVVVAPGWLAAYADAFRRWSEAAVFGGPIRPKYETPVIKWIAECEALLVGPYAIRDFGDEVLPLSVAEGRLPFGANYALRGAEQRVFRYNPDLGLGPIHRRLGEESNVIGRILQSGSIGYWVPQARVDHYIGHERQTVRYIARHFEAQGETAAFLDTPTSRTDFWFGAPRWCWRKLIQGWLCYQFHRLTSPAPIWMRDLRDYHSACGAIRYWRGQEDYATEPAMKNR